MPKFPIAYCLAPFLVLATTGCAMMGNRSPHIATAWGPMTRLVATSETDDAIDPTLFAAETNQQDDTWQQRAQPPIRPVRAVKHLLPSTEPRQTSNSFRVERLPLLTRLPPVEEDITYRAIFTEQVTGIRSDHAEFYSFRGLYGLAGGLGAAAAMANTGFDEHFVRDAYLDSVILAPSDEFYEKLHQPKFLGDGYYTIPAFAITALAEPLIANVPFGSETAEWGQRSLRTILVGGPPMLGLQLLTGGGRPDETDESSEWQPFKDNNGVSGHSFMGAIPFLSAAKMTDNLWAKGGLYAASTLPGISRINDDAHYFSQAFLGWWLAYLAESAVDRSHRPNAKYRLFAYPNPGGIGLGLEYVR